MTTSESQGFTVIELLITIIIGLTLFISLGQIYSVVISNSAEARHKANASDIAYSQARTLRAQVNGTCVAVPNPSGVSLPSSPTLPPLASGDATIAASIDCLTSNPAVSRVTVTVQYGNPMETVKHVIYAY